MSSEDQFLSDKIIDNFQREHKRTREEWLRPVDPLLADTWNFTQAANGGNWSATRPPNVGNVADTVSEGWEFEGTLNPAKNWRI